MKRDIDEKLIRPEKLMDSRALAKLGCNGCKGCSYCCENRGCVILLDEWDVNALKTNLNMTYGGLLANGFITLQVVDNVVQPGLGTKPGTDKCIFLNEEGRCGIHGFRPGICRLFPLARLYHDDGSFSYFLQEGECPKNNGAKIRIDKWLEISDLKAYEKQVKEYHEALKNLQASCIDATVEEKTKLQTEFIKEHFGA